MHEALAVVDAHPFRARRFPPLTGTWFALKGALDFVGHNLPALTERFVRWNPYPRPWRKVEIPVRDGTMHGVFARGPHASSPGIVYAPGTFNTKDDTPRKAKAIRMWREWGWSVLVVDLRGFGESHALPGGGGYLEARDLVAAADFLSREAAVERVALLGESLGGASALVAAALPGGHGRFSGVLAISPFADLAWQLDHMSTRPPVSHPFFPYYAGYHALLRARSTGQVRNLRDYLTLRAQELDIPLAELLAGGSPARHVGNVRVPALVLHAEDDPVVPAQQARRLAQAAHGNANVRVHVVPRGKHLWFDTVAPDWYWSVSKAFLHATAEAAER